MVHVVYKVDKITIPEADGVSYKQIAYLGLLEAKLPSVCIESAEAQVIHVAPAYDRQTAVRAVDYRSYLFVTESMIQMFLSQHIS